MVLGNTTSKEAMPQSVAPTVASAGADPVTTLRRGRRARPRMSSRFPAGIDGPDFGLERCSDDRLVELARAGSERAYEEILRRYRHQLLSYCSQLLGPTRAEDAVQQAFMQAYVALRRGGQRRIALRPWLYRISHNCSIDILRKNGRDHDQLDPEYDGVPQPPNLVEQREELQRIVEQLRALPEGQRRALTLRELEGRSYKEIAARLGHTTAGVRQLIFRAREALRKGAAALFPLAALRLKVAQHAPALGDVQQAATATAAGDPTGAGITAVGAALVGLGLLAGGTVAAQDPSAAGRHRPVAVSSAASAGATTGSILSAQGLDATRAGAGLVTIGAPRPGDRSSTQAGAPADPGAAAPAPIGPASPAQLVTPAPPAIENQPSIGGPSPASPPALEGPLTMQPTAPAGPVERPVASGASDPKRPAGKPNPQPNKPVAPKPAAQKPSTPKQPAPKQSVPTKSVPKQPVPIKSVPKRSVPKSNESSPKVSPTSSPKGDSVGKPAQPAPKASSPSPARGQGPSKETGPARKPASAK